MTFQLMLAPLENTSDVALRTLCYNNGADVTFTEMARVDALARNNKSAWRKTQLPNNTPTWIQIVGSKEKDFIKFLDKFKPSEGFLGFNLNYGCPSPHLIRHGLGCAMIKRIAKTQRIVKIIKDKGFKCSIKMRLGANEQEKRNKVYLNLIEGVDADFFIVHARHAKQHYETPADFSVYEACVATGKPIIANGDIHIKEQIAQLKTQGLAGAMIGRFAVYNPAIFTHLKGKETPSTEELRKRYFELVDEYHTFEYYQENVLKRLGRKEHLDKTKAELNTLTKG